MNVRITPEKTGQLFHTVDAIGRICEYPRVVNGQVRPRSQSGENGTLWLRLA